MAVKALLPPVTGKRPVLSPPGRRPRQLVLGQGGVRLHPRWPPASPPSSCRSLRLGLLVHLGLHRRLLVLVLRAGSWHLQQSRLLVAAPPNRRQLGLGRFERDLII